MLYPYTSLAQCLKLCLELSTCLAVDFSVSVCVVHTNIADMATQLNASSFAQYTLNRACLPPTPSAASSIFSEVTAEPSTVSSHSGI